ncbi:MAG: hypothetical protein HQK81_02175 [Desulfovibrionaceae bacterium]|nr:hypothetical protein [Desulfovibrionaceae bacterium]MBF0512851.1 hypothetical protein [Desulfovibrionaceae bacterium]
MDEAKKLMRRDKDSLKPQILDLARQAASLGDAKGAWIAGVMTYLGFGAARNEQEALGHFIQAGDAGNDNARMFGLFLLMQYDQPAFCRQGKAWTDGMVNENNKHGFALRAFYRGICQGELGPSYLEAMKKSADMGSFAGHLGLQALYDSGNLVSKDAALAKQHGQTAKELLVQDVKRMWDEAIAD